jgi:phosphatidylglycerophosphate synthase
MTTYTYHNAQEQLPTKQNPNMPVHWSAPNTLTLTGLLCMVIPSCIIIFSAPDLVSPAPYWAYVATAIGIFGYQTLDELDGKQARRTGSSSSLGELFDHGCDAVSAFITVSACVSACQVDLTVGTFAAFIASLMAFQGAHIQVKKNKKKQKRDPTQEAHALFPFLECYSLTFFVNPFLFVTADVFQGLPLFWNGGCC